MHPSSENGGRPERLASRSHIVSSLEENIFWGFGLALVILIVVGVISYRSATKLTESASQLEGTRRVLTAIEALSSDLNEAESAARGYVIAPAAQLLFNYRSAEQAVRTDVQRLLEMTANNAGQQQKLNALRPDIDQRLSLLQESIQLAQLKSAAPAAQISNIHLASKLTKRSRQVFEEMAAEERLLLEKRMRASEVEARQTHFYIFLANGLAFVLIAASALLVRRDLLRRTQAEGSLRRLSAQLLRMQDEERRRIARDLHDSTGQNLVALSINLKEVEKSQSALDTKAQSALSESLQLAEQSLREIRTLSYLLHPPLLEELGLSSALRWYAQGMSERSGMRVQLDMPQDLGRLPRETEIAVFRIVQESLTNIHRHSGSPTASIRMSSDASRLTIEVADQGHGMPREKLEPVSKSTHTGVGLAGMRERVRELNGHLEIHSSPSGTTVKATLPIGEVEE
ncbi:MAG: CHASE3 domain-containing protein [Acidobacteria bacterium]|nr:CHASE3 domain-containing protein [Acidobacteriota bacterium]